jgi:hypothetical protein
MKSFILTVVTLLTFGFAQQAHAQFGIKGGLNFAELKGHSDSASYKTYYHVGILYQAHIIGPLSIQPEIQYSLQGEKLKGLVSNYDTKLHYFTVPVLAKVTLGPVFVEAGPQFGFLVGASQDGRVQVSSNNGSTVDQYKRTDYSIAAGVGLKFSALSIGGRYVAGLNDINDVKNLSGINDPKLQNRVFQLYAAIQFGK